MTTTQALAKLYAKITGKAGRNSAAKIVNDLADNWEFPVVPAPTVNGTYTYVLQAVKSNNGIVYTWEEKTIT